MRTAEQLLAAILAEPQIDEHRRVYADWLSERGDPRGELILLQLMEHEGRATKLSSERARQLIRMHAKRWLGPLAEVLERESVVFERGFPISAKCSPGLRKPERFYDEPRWATFEHLGDPPVGLISQPSVRSLRSISLGRDQARTLLLGSQPLPNIRALTVRAINGRGEGIFDDERAIHERATCLPGLTEIRFEHFETTVPEVWDWATRLSQVRRFAVHGNAATARHWVTWLRRTSSPLESVTLGDARVEITLGHVEQGDWARALVRRLVRWPSPTQTEAILEGLRSRGVTHITVEPP